MQDNVPPWTPSVRTVDRSSDRTDAALVLLALYTAVMLWLLLFRRQPTNLDYWTYVQSSYNLRPFQTLRQMVQLLHHETLARFALMNLAGNVVLFLTLGLLPVIWKPQRRFFVYVLTVSLVVLTIELLQLFTTLGSADIDDWITNTFGACLGFFGWKLLDRRHPTA